MVLLFFNLFIKTRNNQYETAVVDEAINIAKLKVVEISMLGKLKYKIELNNEARIKFDIDMIVKYLFLSDSSF